ncbi:MAG: phosphomannomutase/phosphoglucomutase [Rhodospirillales bacterium]|nr:phosphomannomutase/phosphoglucomutase [Alphaproteobacteria bacterium]MCB1839378.1 phosphomannomutase/phosphoglucomutase [Alphaproteobacteria bacterium]MCB9976279.1 phosphomannomutase/phosphoglucomutase [Rhodospirillales bacterium]
MGAYTFDPTILREYDIRGQIGKNLSEEDAFALGRAFGTYVAGLGGKTVCVGYDGRHSSPALSQALTDGLIETGMDVCFIGLGPTPMLYFAVKHRKADAGIMVTGSHNPPDYNGFKMALQTGPVFGEKIQEIGRISAAGDFASGQGSRTDVDIKNDYVTRLIKDLKLTRDMRVAWDSGNGASGEVLKMLTSKIPGTHVILYPEIDGNFPNHHPDPTVDKNLVDLQKAVKDNACDLGIAFDGDGDRIGVVDENGTVLRCDILMTIYAKEVLKNQPGASIIGDVKCSQVMFDEIKKLGGNPIMWKTGHSLIKDKMAELKAPLAGELSGHIFFADTYYGYDDALYCAVRLLNALSPAQGGLSGLTAHLPVLFNTPEVRFEVKEEEKFDLVPRVYESLKARNAPDVSVDDIDGVRVSTPDGWWLLRPSNTQSVLVARAESSSADGLKRLTDMAKEEVKKLGYDLAFA